MAKNASKKTAPKETKVVAKGPKPDYTPKGGVPVKQSKKIEKELAAVKPPIYYRTEPSFSIREVGAECTWNEASRQLCLDAAQDFLEEYSFAARPLIFEFAKTASLCEDWRSLNDAEFRYHGGLVTKGSHMKRQRFWKFITYIGNGRIPPDLSLRVAKHEQERFNGVQRANMIDSLCEIVKKRALEFIANGSKPDTLIRIECVISYWEVGSTVNLETAPHDYDPVKMKGYKTLADWSTHP